jgi:tetratricopeptide (TPR) repeat protein
MAIDANNSTANNGLLRALKLDQVVELTRTAMDAESAGNPSAAREAFASAVALDPGWQPAVSGLARTRETIATDTYQTIMATGFSALAAGDHAQARAAFRSALKVRPNDADALSALSQLAEDERLGQIVSIQERARRAEKQERWPEAVARYEEILIIDSNLLGTGQDLQRSRMRLDLDTGLNAEINGYDRLNEDKIWQSARALVDRAGAVADPGPILRGQIERLNQLLEIAAKPVPVSFQSDNLTEVVIYKVGTLGFFQNRTVDLRPGRYVAVGTREGFRDVRRSFNVEPDGNRQPIVLSCEDPI